MAQRYNTTDGYPNGRERQDGSPKRDSKKDGLDKNTINSEMMMMMMVITSAV